MHWTPSVRGVREQGADRTEEQVWNQNADGISIKESMDSIGVSGGTISHYVRVSFGAGRIRATG